MVICSQCGSENRTGAHYCRQCGQALIEEAMPAAGDSPDEKIIPPSPGMLIQERFEIQQILEADERCFLLEALDLEQCRNCGFIHTGGDHPFCENCGLEMIAKPGILLRACPAGAISPDQMGDDFVQAGYLYVFEQVPEQQENSTGEEDTPIRLVYGYQSHTGLVRDVNEDSLILLQLSGLNHLPGGPTLGLFAIADGVGGAALGEVASQTAVHHLAAVLMEQFFTRELLGEPISDDELSGVLEQAILTANQAILELQNEREEGNMGSTLTALLIRNQKALIANIGDSRTYLMSGGALKVVTRDHSLVARLVEQGVIEPQEAYTHRHRSVIYRSLGNKGATEIDLFHLDLQRGDRLLLCSDGLWEMVHDPLLEDILLDRQDPQQACDRLIELANQSGGDDNISVIVVNVS